MTLPRVGEAAKKYVEDELVAVRDCCQRKQVRLRLIWPLTLSELLTSFEEGEREGEGKNSVRDKGRLDL